MMTGRTEWTGTATDLLGTLDEEVGEKAAKAKTWPSSARALSGRLRRAATFLRKVGIDISFDREGRARTPDYPDCMRARKRTDKTVRIVPHRPVVCLIRL